ncbi:hypothetical protein D0864_00056 [Hortaea werneckii]|uniref:Ammonium transporter AmtB-like domain-containing protein n=1 Tax=Hortaea werneckii TaxID=91943 RepID=A0A3M7HPB0_HORWE|nr:hypothetical protein D0864_00056 [Hortaea werneckii]
MIASTSSAGVTPMWSSLILGPIAALICHSVLGFIDRSPLDDTMGIFAMHGVGGCVGLMFNAIFASSDTLTGASGGEIRSVMYGHEHRQLYVQLAYMVVCAGYSFGASALLAFAINSVPGLQLRVAKEVEDVGIDQQLGNTSDVLVLTDSPVETTSGTSTPRTEDTAVAVDDGPKSLSSPL